MMMIAEEKDEDDNRNSADTRTNNNGCEESQSQSQATDHPDHINPQHQSLHNHHPSPELFSDVDAHSSSSVASNLPLNIPTLSTNITSTSTVSCASSTTSQDQDHPFPSLSSKDEALVKSSEAEAAPSGDKHDALLIRSHNNNNNNNNNAGRKRGRRVLLPLTISASATSSSQSSSFEKNYSPISFNDFLATTTSNSRVSSCCGGGGGVEARTKTSRRENSNLKNTTTDPEHNKDPNNTNNRLTHFVHLLLCLFLSSGLALLAAWDAKEQCVRRSNSEYSVVDQLVEDVDDLYNDDNENENNNNNNNNNLNYMDDEAQQEQEGGGVVALMCIDMFQRILVPTAAITMGLACLALAWIWKCYDSTKYKNSCCSLFATTGLLLFLSLGMAAAQTYQILAVMLRPRVDAVDQDNNSSNNNNENDNNNNNNPYQSLAAVDRYGHVGDNANLFFLSWISFASALALFYQLFTAFVRLYRSHYRDKKQQHQLRDDYYHDDNNNNTNEFVHLGDNPASSSRNDSSNLLLFLTSSNKRSNRQRRRRLRLLRATSWMDREKSQLKQWYQTSTLYRLRFRTGIWVATLVACLVVVASSYHTWQVVLVPNAGDLRWNHVCSAQSNYRHYHDQISYYYSYTRRTSNNSNFSKRVSAKVLCHRTVIAGMSGLIASALCATAIGMHLTSRRVTKQQQSTTADDSHLLTTAHHLLQESNSASSMIRSAALYHSRDDHTTATMNNDNHHDLLLLTNRLPLTTELVLSILLSILLGFNAVFSTGVQGPASTVGNLYFASWLAFFLCVRICLGCVEEAQNLAEHDNDHHQDSSTTTTNDQSNNNKNQEQQQQQQETSPPVVDPVEKDRLKRLRSYFFLCIFSIVCGASAYDAASFSNRRPSQIQTYMMLAPCIVAAISGILFLLCLSKGCYVVLVSRFCVGGLLSVLCFGLWLGDLVLTMHSEDSWAVNKVGEIVVANLYFYSWAGILSAGLLMMSYVKALFEVKHTDYMSMVWIAVCKVCFVILGAALHIWHTIADSCEFDEITSGAVTFCSRTVLAIVVSLAGMLVGGLVVFGRLMVALCQGKSCCCIVGPRTQAHVEMLVSMFLVLLFSATVALVTGIGGPGQSVGDLYFSTWLSFIVSLGIFVQCEAQVRKDKPALLPLPPTTDNKNSSNNDDNNNHQVILSPPINGSVLV